MSILVSFYIQVELKERYGTGIHPLEIFFLRFRGFLLFLDLGKDPVPFPTFALKPRPKVALKTVRYPIVPEGLMKAPPPTPPTVCLQH
jgi:hypothetical protein